MRLPRNAFALAVQAQAPLTLRILLVLTTVYRRVTLAFVLLLAGFSMGPSQFKEARPLLGDTVVLLHVPRNLLETWARSRNITLLKRQLNYWATMFSGFFTMCVV